jgi:hypothetical protein
VLPYFFYPVLALVNMYVTVTWGYTFLFWWVSFSLMPALEMIFTFENDPLSEEDQKQMAKESSGASQSTPTSSLT